MESLSLLGGCGAWWWCPFVTGIVPVVGTQSISPVRERWQRLQYERLRQPDVQSLETRGSVERPIPIQRKVDDPPLILSGDS